MASDTSMRISYSRTSLRHRVIQPNVLSTTQRRGSTWKPTCPGSLRTTSSVKSLVGGQACQPATVVGAIGEQMLQSWPALADGTDDLLRPVRVLHVGRLQVDHQQPPIRVTATCRLRPFSFLPASYPPPPGACGALTVWLSATPYPSGDGVSVRPRPRL